MAFKKGFTLVEVIVGTALLGLVSVLIASIYFTNFKLFSHQSTSIDINSQNKLAIDEISNQIRQSQSVAASCPNPPCNPTETSSSTVLALQLWPLDANGDPKDPLGGTDYDYIVYKIDPANSSRIQKKIAPDASSTRPASAKVLATSLSANGLSFTYKDGSGSTVSPSAATEVTISISTTGTSVGKTQTVTQTNNATLRNK